MADSDPIHGVEERAGHRKNRLGLWAVFAVVAVVVVVGGLALLRSDPSSDSSAHAGDGLPAAPPPDATEPAVTTGSTAASTTEASSSTSVVPTTSAPPMSTAPSTTTMLPPTTSTQPAVSAPSATVIVSYSPFDGGGALVEPVVGSEPGSCAGAAYSTHRVDAYRCTVGSEIHDPCFAPPVGEPTQVACLESTPGAGVRVLALTDPLSPVGSPTAGPLMPFVFMLDDGTACTPFTGTAPIFEGIRMDYGCGSEQTGLLFVGGALEASSATWVFLMTSGDLSGPLETTPIATAYL